MQQLRRAALMVSLAALSLAACDTLGLGSGDSNVTVSFAVPRASAGGGGAAALIPITDGTHNIDLQHVDLVLNKVVLERAEGDDMEDTDEDTDSDSDSDGREDHSLRVGAVTVELPVAGGTITPINARLPDGLYEEVRLDVAFVRARGTFDGQPFDITVAVNSKFDMEIDPPFEVNSDDDRLNLTVTIDLSKWFLANNILLDPRTVQLNETARSTLVSRIRASFHAFEDEDRDADDRDTDTDTDRSGSNRGRG